MTYNMIIIRQKILIKAYNLGTKQTIPLMIIMLRLILLLLIVLNVRTWCEKTSIQEPNNIVQVDYAPNNLYFVTANGNGNVNIYSTSTYQMLSTYTFSGKIPSSVKYSKTSTYIGIGYQDSATIQILNGGPPFALNRSINTGAASATPQIGQVDFKYDDTQIMACGKDRVYSYYLSNGSPNLNINPLGGGQPSVACRYSSTGSIALAQSTNYIFFFNSGGSQTYTTVYSTVVNQLDFPPGSNTYYQALNNNTILANGTTVFTENDDLYTISYSRLGNIFAFGGKSKTFYIFNATSNISIAKFTNFIDIIYSVKISPDQMTIITGDKSGKIKLFTTTCQQKCQSGQYNSSNVCTKCSVPFPYCSKCTSSACFMCIPGFYISGSSCVSCSSLEGCFSCNTSAICVTCLDGYYLNAGNTCTTCIGGGLAGCIACNSSTICTSCIKNQYYLNTGTNSCIQCASLVNNCIKCFDSATCIECQVGFYADGVGVCQKCSSINCLICQSSTNCTECVVGYYAVAGACSRCASNCLQCNQTAACYDCQEGYFLTGANSCSICTTPCLTCFGTSTNCTQCTVSGFFYSGSNTCSACIVNCQTCNSTVSCLSCYVGYIYNTAGPNCLPCSSQYQNCSQCTSTICQGCSKGFYLDGSNLCKTCNLMPYCMQCVSSTNCTHCLIGYYQTGGAGAASCAVCSLGCQQCISSTNCTNCAIQYYKNAGNVCSPCPNHCVQCQTNTFCYSCEIDYFIDGTTANLCVHCQSTLNYCETCLNSTNCISCMMGTYLDSTFKCQFCSFHCLTCSTTDCISCQIGYYVSGTPKTCIKCTQFCQQCSSPTNCLSCLNNYYLNSTDFTCRNCSMAYQHCQECDQATCLRCTFGYTLNSTNACVFCQNQISKCTKCNLNNAATLICQQCSYGFTLASNSLSCLSCNSITGCVTCSSASICNKCQIGYYLKAGFTCGLCNSSCLTCNNLATCIDCKKGWVWDTGSSQCSQCQSLVEGCQTCYYSATFKCTQCTNGYYLFTDNLCHLCSSSRTGCSFCNDSSTCTLCLDNYYLKADNSCDRCSIISGCQLCNSSTVCLECQSGFYLTGTNQCLKCVSNIAGCLYCLDMTHCLQCQRSYYLDTTSQVCLLCESQLVGCLYCNDINTCIQCRSGFYLNTGTQKCQVCSQQGCQICMQSAPTQCVSCNSRYYLDGSNNCIDCVILQPGCIQCDNSVCLQCDIGYYLTSGNNCNLCSNALSGCWLCSSLTSCLQCKSGYFVNSSNQCQECSSQLEGCQYCDNSTTCKSCQINFYLNSTTNVCNPCTDIYGCLICQNSTTCVLCNTKYYLSSSACFSCSVILGCFDCINSTVCTQCSNGYVLDSSTYKCVSNQVQMKLPVQGLKLVSYYVNKTTLKHILYSLNNTFTPTSSNITANGFSKLQIVDYSGKTIDLTITSYEFGSNGYSLIFYTDNPLQNVLNSGANSYNLARRFLLATPSQGAFQINLNVNLNMDPIIYNQILPSLAYDGSMSVSYSLNDPQFYRGYFQAHSDKFSYQLFGYVVMVLLLFNYAIKYFKTCPKASQRGQLFTHLVCVKTCSLILYPTYFQYIMFCSGFMATDIPWTNSLLAGLITNQSDDIATPFGLFYDNMGICATFLVPLAAYLFLYLIGIAYFSDDQKRQKSVSSQSNDSQDYKSQQIKLQNVQKQMGINYKISPQFMDKNSIIKRNYFQFIHSIFCFGIIFYSCISFQGALINPQKIINLNGLSYIIGILIYIGVIIQTLYSFFRNHLFINKLRLLFKVTLLSLAHINPIYFVSTCIVLDSALIYVQYFIIRKKDDWRIHYTVLNSLCNVNILIMIFVPHIKLTLILTAAFIVLCLLLEVYLHFKQYRKNKQNPNFWDKEKNQEFKLITKFNTTQGNIQEYTKGGNIWDLNLIRDKAQITIEQPNEQFWDKQQDPQKNNKNDMRQTKLTSYSRSNQNQNLNKDPQTNIKRNRRSRAGHRQQKKDKDIKKQTMVQKTNKPAFTFDQEDLGM